MVHSPAQPPDHVNGTTVPFLDLRPTYHELRDELDAAYSRFMQSGTYVLGEAVESFERSFAAYCGVDHCVGVGCGQDALTLILQAYEIGAGHEVIVPAHTCIATWLAVSAAGAVPVPVDPDQSSYTMTAEAIDSRISPRTRAIMPVHMYGLPVDMDPIVDLAQSHGIKVVEDAAQAHGARYRGKVVGGLGDAAGFSLYPTKNLGAFGDAGAITTNDPALAKKLRLLRNCGSAEKNVHKIKGVNSRIDALQSLFLMEKLRRLDDWNERRHRIAERYLGELAGLPRLVLPTVKEWADPAWHLFVVRHPERDKLRRHLHDAGIATLVHYPEPPHLSEAYSDAGFERGDFPVAESYADSVISLPLWPHMDDGSVGRVIQAIRSFERS